MLSTDDPTKLIILFSKSTDPFSLQDRMVMLLIMALTGFMIVELYSQKFLYIYIYWGAHNLTRDSLKVVWTAFSTLSNAVLMLCTY